MENKEKLEMKKHLFEKVIPVLRQAGFKGTFPHFRRVLNDRINLLTFQFDTNSGGFVIEIANCSSGGYTTSWGKKIEPNKLTAHHLDVRKRIQSNMKTSDSLTDDWFRYDYKPFLGFGNVYDSVCNDVISKLPIAEEYWAGEVPGE